MLNRHQQSCTNVTKVSYVEKSYDPVDDVKAELIKKGVLPPEFSRAVASFDIESLQVPVERSIGKSTVLHGCQTPISVALSTSSHDYFFLRQSMNEKSITDMVGKFLEKVEEISDNYYAELPSSLKDYYDDIKEQLLGPVSVRRKNVIYAHANYIRNLFKMPILGFNSQDLVV